MNKYSNPRLQICRRESKTFHPCFLRSRIILKYLASLLGSGRLSWTRLWDTGCHQKTLINHSGKGKHCPFIKTDNVWLEADSPTHPLKRQQKVKNWYTLLHYIYSRTLPKEHSGWANTPLERTVLTGQEQFSCLTASMHGTETNKIIQVKFEPWKPDFKGVHIFLRSFNRTATWSEPTCKQKLSVWENPYTKMDGP